MVLRRGQRQRRPHDACLQRIERRRGRARWARRRQMLAHLQRARPADQTRSPERRAADGGTSAQVQLAAVGQPNAVHKGVEKAGRLQLPVQALKRRWVDERCELCGAGAVRPQNVQARLEARAQHAGRFVPRALPQPRARRVGRQLLLDAVLHHVPVHLPSAHALKAAGLRRTLQHFISLRHIVVQGDVVLELRRGLARSVHCISLGRNLLAALASLLAVRGAGLLHAVTPSATHQPPLRVLHGGTALFLDMEG
eukprot:scaffold26965_cov106-Isochrysis_galbana.AAC.1